MTSQDSDYRLASPESGERAGTTHGCKDSETIKKKKIYHWSLRDCDKPSKGPLLSGIEIALDVQKNNQLEAKATFYQ